MDDIAQFCLNGHLINPYVKRFPRDNKNFCSKCGKSTITKCPECNAEIEGGSYIEKVAPLFCYKCGKPFPWTESKIKAAKELVQESKELSDNDKNTLAKSIDDIVLNTTEIDLAIPKVKRILKKCKPLVEPLKNIFVDILSEAIKKKLWPY